MGDHLALSPCTGPVHWLAINTRLRSLSKSDLAGRTMAGPVILTKQLFPRGFTEKSSPSCIVFRIWLLWLDSFEFRKSLETPDMAATFPSALIFYIFFIFIISTMMVFIFQRILILLASRRSDSRRSLESFQTFIGFKRAGYSKSNIQSRSAFGWTRVALGSFSNDDGDGNSLISKTTTLHVHHTFFTFLCCHCTTTTWKCLMSRFMENVNKERRTFLSVSKLESRPQEINSSETRSHFTFSVNWNKREKTLILF